MPQASESPAGLAEALSTSFIDDSKDSDPDLRARLLRNGPGRDGGVKVLTVLRNELARCDRFDFSVAFVTMSGITPLLLVLQELAQKGVRGRILTSDYLGFTEPQAIEKLSSLPNLEVRLFRVNEAGPRAGFHTKGYIFSEGGLCRIIVGSSNLTQTALSTNEEWNASIVSSAKGEFARRIHAEFDTLWNHRASHPAADVLDDYRTEYQTISAGRRRVFGPDGILKDAVLPEIRPNLMQKKLAANVLALMQCEDPGQNVVKPKKGLLISATGTGKTYASAFVVRAVQPGRVLFLVHREQIARKSLTSYRRVLGDEYSCGLCIGSQRDNTSRIVFATMQTMVRHLNEYDPNAFDMIIIDEVHRAGAQSYERIMRHFQPHLWFGMTATPDRPDGIDIYRMFDHHILTEIRLQQALENDLLCPFHYFGLTGLSVSDADYERKDLARLASDERVGHILRQSQYFGAGGKRIKSLVFCSSVEEARLLSEKFNERGLRTTALSGDDPLGVREKACARLAADEGEDTLDYIFSVDIFNEGIDIPQVNQVILLRPTQSTIVFVQQIGRGLRKYDGKEYVVILDFIGACETNFMIPAALTGDRSFNKETLRRRTVGATELLSGPSSVQFDSVARDRIYRAIDAARTNSAAMLREAYRLLRFKLGRVPNLRDFDEHGSVDPARIFACSGSYHRFLRRLVRDPDYTAQLSAAEDRFLAYLTERIGNAQRLTEAIVLERLLAGDRVNLKAGLEAALTRLESAAPSERRIHSCELILTSNFWRTSDLAKANADCAVVRVLESGEWAVTDAFAEALANPDFAAQLKDLVDFVRRRFESVYSGGDRETALKLYERYTYEDVCRLLNWERNMPAQNIGGYVYDKRTKTLPVFVNYEKSAGAIAYEDRFVSENHLVALSKTNRKTDSVDADRIYKRTAEDKGNRLYLFVRKNKDDKEAKSFYFLGEIDAQGGPLAVTLKDGKDAFEINYRLRSPVREDIFSYLTN